MDDLAQTRPLTDAMKYDLRVPYGLRRVPDGAFASLLPLREQPSEGDIALARLEKLGKNTGLELPDGRRCALHESDLLAVVFGNRYATEQFEGYVGVDGARCDLLSMGGLCGLAKTKHANVLEPTRLQLLGMLGDPDGQPLRLQQFTLPALTTQCKARVIVVCGTAMDTGKTHTATSLVVGLKRRQARVAAIKLTGTACGRDLWSMKDAGADPVFSFVDGGLASTYCCKLEQLLALHQLLLAHANVGGAEWIVFEIADGLLQKETAALMQASPFAETVHHWILATGDPVAALGAIGLLRGWGIEAAAITGLITLSPLAMREAESATGVPCMTARDLQNGKLLDLLDRRSSSPHLVTANQV